MKIYFAGSIRGGREDVEIYNKIIERLKKYGEVLTEHVGDYSLSIKGQNQLDDNYIHDRDINWLKSCEVVVAEVTVPSLGVGYEIATAVDANIPVIALFRNNERIQLSAMIAGSSGITNIEYDDLENAISQTEKIIEVKSWNRI